MGRHIHYKQYKGTYFPKRNIVVRHRLARGANLDVIPHSLRPPYDHARPPPVRVVYRKGQEVAWEYVVWTDGSRPALQLLCATNQQCPYHMSRRWISKH